MNLSQSHDSGREFNRLTRIDSCFFGLLFLIDFFQSHPSTLSWLEIKFCNLFCNFLSMSLSRSRDPDNQFIMLT
jgi:hypothetical protein